MTNILNSSNLRLNDSVFRHRCQLGHHILEENTANHICAIDVDNDKVETSFSILLKNTTHSRYCSGIHDSEERGRVTVDSTHICRQRLGLYKWQILVIINRWPGGPKSNTFMATRDCVPSNPTSKDGEPQTADMIQWLYNDNIQYCATLMSLNMG